jgi:transcriptional regulator with XRE-family HTH domain
LLGKIADLFADYEARPNKLTRFMGERIRLAREESGYSQEKLAQLIYLRRATLSDIENGKAEASSGSLTLLAYYLKKPLAYFIPAYYYKEIHNEDLTPLENELILHFRDDIVSDHLRKVIIGVVKALGTLDVDAFVLEQAPLTAAQLEDEKEMRKWSEKRRKKK